VHTWARPQPRRRRGGERGRTARFLPLSNPGLHKSSKRGLPSRRTRDGTGSNGAITCLCRRGLVRDGDERTTSDAGEGANPDARGTKVGREEGRGQKETNNCRR